MFSLSHKCLNFFSKNCLSMFLSHTFDTFFFHFQFLPILFKDKFALQKNCLTCKFADFLFVNLPIFSHLFLLIDLLLLSIILHFLSQTFHVFFTCKLFSTVFCDFTIFPILIYLSYTSHTLPRELHMNLPFSFKTNSHIFSEFTSFS